MKKKNFKKLIILNIPYVLIGLVATNVGEAFRIAGGTNASEKGKTLRAWGSPQGHTHRGGFLNRGCGWR